MKITGATRTQQQSLGRMDVTATAEAGKVAQVQGVSEGLQKSFNAMAETTAKLNDVRNDRFEQQAGLMAQKVEADFWNEWDPNKEFYNVNEIPQEFVTEGMVNRGRVLSAEVLPKMYNAWMKEKLPDAAAIIENDARREKWAVDSEEKLVGRMIGIQNQANQRIEKQIFDDQMINYDNARKQGRPDVGKQIVADMKQLSDDERKKLNLQLNQDAEEIVVDTLIGDSNIEGMRKALDYYSQSYEDYEKENGVLYPEGKLQQRERLAREIYKIDKANEIKPTVDVELMRNEIKVATSEGDKGNLIPLESFTRIIGDIREAEALGVDNLKAEKKNVEVSRDYAVSSNNMLLKNSVGRIKHIEDFKKSDYPEPYKSKILRRLEDGNDATTELELKNKMDAGIQRGLIQEINIDPEIDDIPTMMNKISLIKEQSDYLAEYLKVENNTLPTNTAAKLGGYFNRLSVDEQVDFAGSLFATMGRDSNKIIDELRVNGGIGGLAIAGEVYTTRGKDAAKIIMSGASIAKESGKDLLELKKDFDAKYESYTGQAYTGNRSYRNANKEGAFFAYLGILQSRGMPTDNLKTGSIWNDIFSDGEADIVSQALDMATGGIIEFSESKISAPEYGVTTAQFKRSIARTPPKAIDEMGGINKRHGLTNNDFARKIANEEYTLEDTDKKGSYVVRDEDGYIISNKDGGRFIYKYNPDIDFSPKSVRDVDAEQDAISKYAPLGIR